MENFAILSVSTYRLMTIGFERSIFKNIRLQKKKKQRKKNYNNNIKIEINAALSGQNSFRISDKNRIAQ